MTEYSAPRYYQPAGSSMWAPIDTTLVAASGRAGWWQSSANRWSVAFGPLGSSGGSEQLVSPGTTFGVVPIGVTGSVTPVVSGSTVTYPGAWAQTDAAYGVSPLGVDERLVLHGPGSSPTYAFDLVGVTAHANAAGGLDLVAGNTTVATVPPLTVSTSTRTVPLSAAGAAMTAMSDAAGQPGGRIVISLNPAWLSALPASAYPIVIDPTVLTGTYPNSAVSMTQAGSTSGVVEVGTDAGALNTWRATAYFPVPSQIQPGASPPWQLISANLSLVDDWNATPGPPVSTSAQFSVSVLGEPSQPTSFSLVTNPTSQSLGTAANPGNGFVDVTSWVAAHGASWYGFTGDENPANAPSRKLFTNATFNGAKLTYNYYQAPPPTGLASPSGVISTTTPTLYATVTDTSDACVYYDFKIGTNPDATGTVIDSGWLTAGSACGMQGALASPAWQVPVGALSDGMSYYVSVLDDIGTYPWTPGSYGYVPPAAPLPAVRLVVKQRLGAGGPSPTDTVGAVPGQTATPAEGTPSPGTSPASVTVNMVTGNLALAVNTHTLGAVGGTATVTLNYNSLGSSTSAGLADGQYGLSGQYYTDSGSHTFSASNLIGQRLDPTVNLNWPSGAPMGGYANGNATLARWTGTIAVPAGTWQLGGLSGGGMRVYVDGAPTPIFDNWSGTASTSTPSFGSTLGGSAGQPHQIEVDYWSQGSQAAVQLWANNTAAPPGQPGAVIVSTGWLRPQTGGLPAGWRLSPSTFSGGWTRIDDAGTQAVLQSASGATAAFTRRSDGSYQAPPGDTDLLSVNKTTTASSSGPLAAGLFQLATSDNYLYTFNPDGTLQGVKSIADDRHLAGLQYGYGVAVTGGRLVLQSITDPVSNRQVALLYGAANCPNAPSSNAPPGMLCEIDFWDAMQTTLTYNTNGQLAQIVNPGGPTASFGYDSAGRLAEVRDPIANDTLSYNLRPADCPSTATTTPACDTSITYDTAGRVSTVTQPAPTAGAARPQRTYTYTTSSRQTTVNVAGFTPASGYATQVAYDSQGRVVSQSDSAQHLTRTIWDPNIDRPLAIVDPANEQTSSAYDTNNNLTDTWGPAPTGCFDPGSYMPVPNPATATGCGIATVPNTHNGFDEGLTSLAAAYWPNPRFAGPPVAHGTGLGGTGPSGVAGCNTGSFCTQWNPAGAAPVIPTADTCCSPAPEFNWALRLTGTITFNTAGNWRVSGFTTQRMTVYLDGVQVSWADPYFESDGGTYGQWVGGYDQNPQSWAAGPHHLQIDYLGATTSLNGLILKWVTPQGVGGWTPTSALNPAYGLKTSVTDPDLKTTTTSYANGAIGPEYGLPTAVTQDPGGLALTTTSTYETPGTGHWLRKTATTLPAGTTTNFTYYCGQPGTPECTTDQTSGAVASGCGVNAGDRQWGLLAQQTDPAPDAVTPARVQQFLYDPAGRIVGRRLGPATTINTAPWQCTTYDVRGRTTTQTWPASGPNGPARTATYNYYVTNNPLITSVSDPAGTITSTVDLLGRVVSYTDAQNTTTTTTYDQVGRTTTTTGPQGTVTVGYDPNTSQLTSVAQNGTLLATATYDSTTGRMTSGSYLNGSTFAVTYDPYGNKTGLTFTKTSRIAGDQITKSPGGRVLTDRIETGSANLIDPNPGGNDFVYDGAGRLTQAYLNQINASYSYATNAPSDNCAHPATGANTNRTSITWTPAVGATTSTHACYNNADQLTSTVTNGTPSALYTYDLHGNQTTDNTTTLTWDAADRLAQATSGANTVTYTRDALDRVIQRTDPTTTTRYAYSGYSDTPAATLDASNRVVQQFVALPAGVLLTAQTSGNIWSYPNLQGNYITATDNAGLRQGTPVTYDPWGAEYPPGPPVHNATANADFGAKGADGKLEEHGIPSPLILMGARPMSPTEARFLSVDPVQGGCANAYTYSFGDPINHPDLSGKSLWNPASWQWGKVGCFFKKNWESIVGIGLSVASLVVTAPVAAFLLAGAGIALSYMGARSACNAGDGLGCGLGIMGVGTGLAGLGSLVGDWLILRAEDPSEFIDLKSYLDLAIGKGSSGIGAGLGVASLLTQGGGC